MSKSNVLENDVVDFIFNATAFPSYGPPPWVDQLLDLLMLDLV